ncbi:hypothetical protein SAMN05192529_11541 [Arachidicoccus rhizosphaerae]|uniref:Uncharacterized protein n=1 Tax=Arachidicoccus rhizosphaerae TaxID=551991 RepID=A0A1H4AL82_9BACT|nr:hypothetical protein SAMN05192529_11541 [Arachidicoccus rhizosphaerae]
MVYNLLIISYKFLKMTAEIIRNFEKVFTASQSHTQHINNQYKTYKEHTKL